MELERKKYWLLFYGLIIGVSFDIFFYNKTLGISYLIFIVLILLILLGSFWGSLKKLNNLLWLFTVPILAIIIWLLSSADIVFKNLFLNIPISKIIRHFLVIITVSVYTTCFLWALIKAFNE